MKELIAIQYELKVPKSKYNKFGNFNFRSSEDILKAVKPLLTKYGCILTLSDEIVQFGERLFVKAIAEFITPDGKQKTTIAYAEHAPEKKGMDVAQITGSASSYARKYALSGLLLIDDGRDADDQNAMIQTTTTPPTINQMFSNLAPQMQQVPPRPAGTIPPPPPAAKK